MALSFLNPFWAGGVYATQIGHLVYISMLCQFKKWTLLLVHCVCRTSAEKRRALSEKGFKGNMTMTYKFVIVQKCKNCYSLWKVLSASLLFCLLITILYLLTSYLYLLTSHSYLLTSHLYILTTHSCLHTSHSYLLTNHLYLLTTHSCLLYYSPRVLKPAQVLILSMTMPYL